MSVCAVHPRRLHPHGELQYVASAASRRRREEEEEPEEGFSGTRVIRNGGARVPVDDGSGASRQCGQGESDQTTQRAGLCKV